MKIPVHGPASILLAMCLAACSTGVPSSGTGGFDGGADARPDGGTGGSASGSGGITGTGGSSSSGSGGLTGSGGVAGSAGGAGGASTACSVTLMPQTDVNLVPGAGSKVRMIATLRNNRSGRTPVWKWNATFEYATEPKILMVISVNDPNLDTSIVDIPINDAGSYKIKVDSGLSCSAMHILGVNPPAPASYLFRITPPPSLDINIPLQERQQVLSLQRDCGEIRAPCIDPINLDQGDRLSIQPVDLDFRPIASIVRVSLPSLKTTMDGYTDKGPFEVVLLRNTLFYEVLIVPDGSLAPKTFFDVTASSLPPFIVDEGTLISGTVTDGAGSPLLGARVAMAATRRPSTVGVSDGGGRFSLRTRSGPHSVRIVPPAAAGLPDAQLPVGGVEVDGDATVQVTWKKFVQAPLSISVKSTDGAQPMVGSQVRADGLEPLSSVATLTGLRPSPTTLPGAVHSEVVTDAEGLARFPNLPVGTYEITIVPPPVPSGMPDSAITVVQVMLTTAGYAATVPLLGHINISGILLPEGMTAGTRVVARDETKGITAPVVSTVVGPKGEYSLALDPSRKYLLVADPPQGSMLARTTFRKEVPTRDSTAGPYSVDKGVFAQGSVTSGYRRIAGALVQVYCFAAADVKCLDPTYPVAEAVTRADGTYTVRLASRPLQ